MNDYCGECGMTHSNPPCEPLVIGTRFLVVQPSGANRSVNVCVDPICQQHYHNPNEYRRVRDMRQSDAEDEGRQITCDSCDRELLEVAFELNA